MVLDYTPELKKERSWEYNYNCSYRARGPMRPPSVVVRRVLSSDDCDELVKGACVAPYPLALQTKDGTEGKEIAAQVIDLDLEETRRMQNKMMSLLLNVNSLYYRYKKPMTERTGIICQYKKGDFRKWHIDGGYADESGFLSEDIQKFSHDRVLTLVVQLSKSRSYSGGDLRLMAYHDFPKAAREQGTALIFPSTSFHQVDEVKRGTRRSLCAFLCSAGGHV